MLRGGCFCRAVRYEIDAEPTNQTICHCTMCRHAAGAPSVAWFSVPPDSVRFVAGEPQRFKSSEHATRSFCPECGTTLTYQSTRTLRRPRHHDLLARRARPGGAQGPHLRAVEAFLDDAGRRPAGLSDDPVGRRVTGEPIRPATVADADAIAALHAASWRSAYRGIFKDSTLGPALDDERRTHWRNKLAAMMADDTVLIAGDVGFIAVWAEGDPGFGAYIDNLHVHPERRSGGARPPPAGRGDATGRQARRDGRLSLGVRRQPARHRFLSPAGRRDRRRRLRRDRRTAGRAQPHHLA